MRTKMMSAMSAAMLLLCVDGALALPGAALSASAGVPEITLVEGGCGPGWVRGPGGRCYPPGRPVVVEPAPVVVAPPVVVVPGGAPVVCGAGFRWHPRFRRCVVL
jgi:hypothetical protein